MIYAIYVVATCLVISACSYESKSAPQPTVLVSGICSYLNPTEVKKLINTEPKQWRVVEDEKTKQTDKRPPYHRLILAVNNYEDLGERGEARFSFFNDRLSAVWFYPTDINIYKAKLQREKGIRFDQKDEAYSSKRTKIRIGKDYTGRLYVAFEDSTLEKELMEWISRYS